MEPGESNSISDSIPICSNNAESLAAATACSRVRSFQCPAHTKDELPVIQANRLEQRIQRCRLSSSIDELNRSSSVLPRRRCQAHLLNDVMAALPVAMVRTRVMTVIPRVLGHRRGRVAELGIPRIRCGPLCAGWGHGTGTQQ